MTKQTKRNLIIAIVALMVIVLVSPSLGLFSTGDDYCIDSDGLDYTNRGFVDTSAFGIIYDHCDDDYIVERICRRERYSGTFGTLCTNGCSNGACVDEPTSCSYNVNFDPCGSCAKWDRIVFEHSLGYCDMDTKNQCKSEMESFGYQVTDTSCVGLSECQVTLGSECTTCEIAVSVMNNAAQCPTSLMVDCKNNIETIQNEFNKVMGYPEPMYCGIPDCSINSGLECTTCEITVDVLNERSEDTQKCGSWLTDDCHDYLSDNYPIENGAIYANAQGDFYCETCESHFESKCWDNDVYWFNSCNTKEEKKEECGAIGCFGGECGTGEGFCTDTDGGEDRYVKGTVTYGDVSYTDTCLDSDTVYEQFCIGVSHLDCSSGEICDDGACVDIVTTSSFDLNQVLFTLGTFEVTLLYALIFLGGILLLVIIK